MLEFYIEDTGIGIPENKFQDIFKRFRQANTDIAGNYGGSGLGLAIAKAYVSLLGGEIWLKSEIAKGSTFFLPYHMKKLLYLQNYKILVLTGQNFQWLHNPVFW